jgi:ABC-type glycerol-3-phosphate transport system substrate-binding protein
LVRRGAAGVALAGPAGLALAACGAQGAPATTTAARPSTGPVTLQYAFYASEPDAVVWKRLCEEFSKQSGRITVQPYQTNADGNHFARMRTLIAAGSESHSQSALATSPTATCSSAPQFSHSERAAVSQATGLYS